MQREGFIIYKSFYEPLKILSDEQLGKLFRAIFEYQVNGIEEVDGEIKMAFEFFKNQFRLDNDKYQKIIERNKINGSKGGRPKTQENQKNPMGLKKPKKADKDKEKDKDNIKENNKKKSYGEFNNVLLTDEEYAKLDKSNLLSYIEILSSYIASKGKRYKSHYATILSWSRKDKVKEKDEYAGYIRI